MTDAQRLTAYKLIHTGTLVDFDVTETQVDRPDALEETAVRITMKLGGEDEDGEPTEDAEWGAFGFIFVLAALSFADARPRGYSEADFIEGDDLTIDDFLGNLGYSKGQLRFSADYIRGRCLKTHITVKPDETAILETVARGEAASRWVDRLKGKKTLELVPAAEKAEL